MPGNENVTSFGSDLSKLDTAFDMSDEKLAKIKGIKGRMEMPDPDKKNTKTVRILYYQGADNKLNLYKEVSGAKFKTPAIMMNVEEVDAPGVQKDMPLSKTLNMAIRRELENAGKKFEDIAGCVFTISADYWKSAPKSKRSQICPKCGGNLSKPCDFCVVSGTGIDGGQRVGLRPPTRFDAQLRKDLMGVSGTGNTAKVSEF